MMNPGNPDRDVLTRSFPADKNTKQVKAVFYTSHLPFFITSLNSSDGIGRAK